MEHRLVADGELVIAGGDGPVALEPVNAALHRVPVLVPFRAEGRWPAAAAARGGSGCRTRSAGSGMVAAMPWRRSQPRIAREA